LTIRILPLTMTLILTTTMNWLWLWYWLRLWTDYELTMAMNWLWLWTDYDYELTMVCHTSGAGNRESELMDALRLILDRLNSGNIPITEEMVKRAQTSGLLSAQSAAGSSTYTVHGGRQLYCILNACCCLFSDANI